MKKAVKILLILITLSFISGCSNMRNAEAVSQESIMNYKNAIQNFADDNGYDVEFIPTQDLDEGISLEGKINSDNARERISFMIYTDGLVWLDSFLEEKEHLDKHLLDIIDLSNKLSKRQITVEQVNEFLQNEEYVKTNDPNYIYKHKAVGWWSDSTISYSEREYYISIDVCTGIIH